MNGTSSQICHEQILLYVVDKQETNYELRTQLTRRETIVSGKSVGVQVAMPCIRCASFTVQEADPKVRKLLYHTTWRKTSPINNS